MEDDAMQKVAPVPKAKKIGGILKFYSLFFSSVRFCGTYDHSFLFIPGHSTAPPRTPTPLSLASPFSFYYQCADLYFYCLFLFFFRSCILLSPHLPKILYLLFFPQVEGFEHKYSNGYLVNAFA